MDVILSEFFLWLGVDGISEMSTVADLFDVTIRAAIGCGFLVFFFKQIFNLSGGFMDRGW